MLYSIIKYYVMNESVGYYLRRAREVREIELEDIAKKTKISVRFLKAIEEGKWHLLPGDVFVKGFIRAYAQFLGLNSDEIVEKYVQEKGLEPKNDFEVLQKKSIPIKLIYLFVGFLFLIFIISLFIFLKKSKGLEVVVSLEKPVINTEKISEKENPVVKNIATELELLFMRHCWIRVEIDGNKVFEGFKETSDKLEYAFKDSFVLKVGDAGALQVIKDGVPQPRLGDDGQPVLYKLP